MAKRKQKDNSPDQLQQLAETIVADLQSGKLSPNDFLKFLKSDVFKAVKKIVKSLPKEKKVHIMNLLGLQIKYDGTITNEKVSSAGRAVKALGSGFIAGFKTAWKAAKENVKEDDPGEE